MSSTEETASPIRLQWSAPAAAEMVARIGARIDADGYCVLHDFVTPEELDRLTQLAEHTVASAGDEYVSFGGQETPVGSVWNLMAESPTLVSLSHQLYRHSTGTERAADDFYQVFRCLKGNSAMEHSYYFHYDSYILTILVPVVIPRTGLSGNLLMFPSARPIRASYWRNLLDKAVAESKPMQRLNRWRAGRPRSRALSIALTPGTAVLFWGYRSLHANEPCDPDKLRATALLHFGNLHGERRAEGRAAADRAVNPLQTARRAAQSWFRRAAPRP